MTQAAALVALAAATPVGAHAGGAQAAEEGHPVEAAGHHAARAPDPPRAERPASSQGGVETIITTAQRRSEAVQKVPISISVLTATDLEKHNIQTLSQLQNFVPNLEMTNAVGTPVIRIRGIGGGGRNVGFSPRAGVYIDGVYMGNVAASDAMLFDLSRVEVLRGPQGFLFGASADAGAINIVTRAPQPVYSARVIADGGNKSRYDVGAYVNVPISNDLFVKASFSRNSRDGFIYNLQDRRHDDNIDNYGTRIQARYIHDNLTVDISGDYSSQHSRLVVGESTTNFVGTGPSPLPEYTIDQSPEEDTRNNAGLSATVNYALPAVNLTSITGYRFSRRFWLTDLDHTAYDAFRVDPYNDHYATLSQELRVASVRPHSRLRYVGGIYAYINNNYSYRRIATGSEANLIGLPDNISLDDSPQVVTQSIALYGSIDYDIMPELTATAGLRAEIQHQSVHMAQRGSLALGASTFSGYNDSFDERSLTPTAGLNYHVTDTVMLYGKYSRGVKGGGYDVDIVSAPATAPSRFGMEYVNSYEVGLKALLLHRRFMFDVDMYYNNYSAYQTSQFYVGPTGLIVGSIRNAGKAYSWGPELQTRALLLPGLTFDISGAWLAAYYREYANGGGVGVNYTGNRLENAPAWTVQSGLSYSHALPILRNASGFGDLSYSYRSSQYGDASNLQQFRIKGYSLLNADIGLAGTSGKDISWRLSANCDNLLDQRYFVSKTIDALGTILGLRGPRRLYFVKLAVSYK